MTQQKKPEMTSRERVLAAMRREPVDYVPCSPAWNSLSPTQRVGKRFNFPWGPSQHEEIAYNVNELGVDPMVGCSCGGYESAPEVSSRTWFDADTQLIHKVYETPAGELKSTVRYDEKWPHGLDIPFFTDFTPAHSDKFWIESEQDLECFSYVFRPVDDPDTLAGLRFGFMEGKRLADEFRLATQGGIGLGLTGALQTFGPTQLAMKMIEAPDLVDAYLELDHKVNMRRVEIGIDLGIDILGRNGFYETCDFYSPAMLQRFLFDRIQAETKAAHDAGKVVPYTVNTGVMPMLDYLRRLDLDCLRAVDISHKDHDLDEIVASQQGTKSFLIGPSSAYHLQDLDTEVTREAVRECFRVIGRTGLIITPCPSLHSIMPWQSGLAMIDEWKKLR